MSGNLEVDRRNQDLPIPAGKEPYRYQPQTLQPPTSQFPPFSPTEKEVAPDGPRRRNFPRSTLLLGIALALMTLLAILAAAIGGSIAARRGNEVSHLNHLLSQTKQSCPSSSPNSQAENATSSPDLSSSFQPSTNCSAMDGTYTTTLSHDTFKVSCNTDLPGHDMLGVWVFTFADCMEACNSWNLHKETNDTACYAVAYDAPSVSKQYTEASGLGNCWLKREEGIKGVEISSISSGVYQFKR